MSNQTAFELSRYNLTSPFALVLHARQMKRSFRGHWQLLSFDEASNTSTWQSDKGKQVTLSNPTEPSVEIIYIARASFRSVAERISEATGVDTETVTTTLMVWLDDAIKELVEGAAVHSDRIASESFRLPEPPDSWYERPEDAHLEMEYEARADTDCVL